MKTPCYCNSDNIGHSPARPHTKGLGHPPGWVRCFDCMGLWDMDGNPVGKRMTELDKKHEHGTYSWWGEFWEPKK